LTYINVAREQPAYGRSMTRIEGSFAV